MNDEHPLRTRVGTVLGGVAAGLIPMGIFTPVYAIWPVFAWPIPGTVFFVLALAWSAGLFVAAARLRRLGRELPHETGPEDERITKGMTVVSSIQGGLIVASVAVLVIAGAWQWILPVVALIVALHFFPMPAIFGRTIDYYLGGAMLLVAGAGLWLVAQPEVGWMFAWGVTGLGCAIVTGGYGLWMRLTARRVLREYRALAEPARVGGAA